MLMYGPHDKAYPIFNKIQLNISLKFDFNVPEPNTIKNESETYFIHSYYVVVVFCLLVFNSGKHNIQENTQL